MVSRVHRPRLARIYDPRLFSDALPHTREDGVHRHDPLWLPGRDMKVPGQTLSSCPQPHFLLVVASVDYYMSMLMRYISNIRMNLATNASKWKITLVPVLMRCS